MDRETRAIPSVAIREIRSSTSPESPFAMDEGGLRALENESLALGACGVTRMPAFLTSDFTVGHGGVERVFGEIPCGDIRAGRAES